MSGGISVFDALQARTASAIAEAEAYRERNKTLDSENKLLRRQLRQAEHKLDERTIRIRRLEKGCKVELAYLRKQDTDGLWWCTNPKERHRAGAKPHECGRCSVTVRVQDALDGKDIDDE